MKKELFARTLREPITAIAYEMTRALGELAAGRCVLETKKDLEVLGFAREGRAEVVFSSEIKNEILTNWAGPELGLVDRPENAWLEVAYEGRRVEAIRLRWQSGWAETVRWWVIADDEPTARGFLEAVSIWSSEVHGEILVFSDGCFEKSSRLHRDIERASWDDLVLRGSLKQDIPRDFEHFFASRATYERHGAPWRRGALFLGPPGNGKTHCVKALVHRLAKPTIYVRGFRHRYRTTADCIAEVFERARHIAPCVMVLEDLDGLFDAEGLAFFLNELDGFAENSGLVTLGTTNHPERLDPALLDRPSRFDRTYAFELPTAEERRAFLSRQNERLEVAGRFGDATIDELVGATDAFSYAYLKELVVGALLAVASGTAPSTEEAARAGLPRLREQLGRARAILDEKPKAAKEADADA
jgi:hypothetical protein